MPDVVKGCLSKRKRIVGQEVGKMGRGSTHGKATGRVWGFILGGNGEPLKVLKQERDVL